MYVFAEGSIHISLCIYIISALCVYLPRRSFKFWMMNNMRECVPNRALYPRWCSAKHKKKWSIIVPHHNIFIHFIRIHRLSCWLQRVLYCTTVLSMLRCSCSSSMVAPHCTEHWFIVKFELTFLRQPKLYFHFFQGDRFLISTEKPLPPV